MGELRKDNQGERIEGDDLIVLTKKAHWDSSLYVFEYSKEQGIARLTYIDISPPNKRGYTEELFLKGDCIKKYKFGAETLFNQLQHLSETLPNK